MTAEGLWQKLRGRPFEEQKRLIRGVRFHSTVLFDLLREKSREVGRRDRRRGVEVAELALISLEGSEDIFGDRIHDLRALGWAWLGNAHALVPSLSTAEEAFEKADSAWAVMRKHEDQLVLARICNLKGKLRMLQRRYDDGLRLVDRSSALFATAKDHHGEARALIQGAAIHGYSDRPEESIAALERAVELIDAEADRYLAFAASTNLANVHARRGRYQEALSVLAEARVHCGRLDHPVAQHEINWVNGDIGSGLGDLSAAEGLYLKARAGFSEARDLRSIALLDLDLAVLYSRRMNVAAPPRSPV